MCVLGTRKVDDYPIVEVVCSGYLKDLEYYDQVKVLVAMREFFGVNRCDLVLEMNNTGIVVEEILRREHRVPCVCVTAV